LEHSLFGLQNIQDNSFGSNNTKNGGKQLEKTYRPDYLCGHE